MKKYFIILFLSCFSSYSEEEQAHLKGWYKTELAALQNQLKDLDKKAQKNYSADLKSVRALIVPHAGYSYSGVVAAAGLRLLDPQKIKRIILIAPSHYAYFSGLATLDVDKYVIPNGVVDFDREVIKDLIKTGFVQNAKKMVISNPFEKEHALEIQLPLIKEYLPQVKVVPLLVGSEVLPGQALVFAQKLKSIISPETAVVVSSDFIHYGPRFEYEPFRDFKKERIRSLDSNVLQPIFHPSTKQFYDVINETKATVCGRSPIMILLALLEQESFGQVGSYLIGYATSSDHEKTVINSVSYITVAFAKLQKQDVVYLTQYEKSALLQLAHDSIENKFTQKLKRDLLWPIITPGLQKAYGAFVTLNLDKELRGCIGSITTSEPLYETVYKRAQDAAFHDARFSPLTKNEFKRVDLKISVLTEPQSIPNYHDIQLGKHGIILKKDKRSAVFLPEVPLEQKWDLKTTLQHLSLKAGLRQDAYKTGAQFEIFTTMDFGEK